MKRKNLTNKQIHDSATTMELIFRMNCLHAECKRRGEDAGIPLPDIWEAVAIVKELRRRLGRLGIFYLEMTNEQTRKRVA